MWETFVAFGPQVLGRWFASWRLGLQPRIFPRDGSFGRRAIVALAGPAASVLLSMLIMLALHLACGAPFPGRAMVASVRPGSPAEQGGLQTGDVICSIDGLPAPREQIAPTVDSTRGRPFAMEVEREGARRTVTLQAVQDGDHFRIGIQVDIQEEWRPLSFGRALSRSVKAPFEQSVMLLSGFWRMLAGREKVAFSGPIGIVKTAESTPHPARVLLWAASIVETEAALLGLPIAMVLLFAIRPRRAVSPGSS